MSIYKNSNNAGLDSVASKKRKGEAFIDDSESEDVPKVLAPKKTSQIAKKASQATKKRKNDAIADDSAPKGAAKAVAPKKISQAAKKRTDRAAVDNSKSKKVFNATGWMSKVAENRKKKIALAKANEDEDDVQVSDSTASSKNSSSTIDQAISIMKTQSTLAKKGTAADRLPALRNLKKISGLIDDLEDSATVASFAAAAASSSAVGGQSKETLMAGVTDELKMISTASTVAETDSSIKSGDYEKTIDVSRRLVSVPVSGRSPTYYRDLRFMYEMQSRLYLANRRRLKQSTNRQRRLVVRALSVIEELHEMGSDCAFIYTRNTQRPIMSCAATPRMRWMLDDPRTMQTRREIFDSPNTENITYTSQANTRPYAYTAASMAPTPAKTKAVAKKPAAASVVDELAQAFDDDIAPPAAISHESPDESDEEHVIDAEHLKL